MARVIVKKQRAAVRLQSRMRARLVRLFVQRHDVPLLCLGRRLRVTS